MPRTTPTFSDETYEILQEWAKEEKRTEANLTEYIVERVINLSQEGQVIPGLPFPQRLKKAEKLSFDFLKSLYNKQQLPPEQVLLLARKLNIPVESLFNIQNAVIENGDSKPPGVRN
ncbi:hypothetical protein [Okeania sp. KiyG1]|uniref:ribbon-helix-helix domain-containing protein n=1 Tax=Okeania sp. KiyG1 TaxID=2720165 RepID=UPI0019219C4B|nr:hypothetical protein [Okeania sp. KiyG1]GGA57377.1 hypothetical protein CYANOKiyG1_78420 [Okeania sp. KiyG1]